MPLGFIIFGWPTKTHDHGPTYPTPCPHCTHDEYYHLVKSRKWLTLYFIPLLPLSRIHYHLVCPRCNASLPLPDHEQVTTAKSLAQQTTAYLDGDLEPGDYTDKVATLTTAMGDGNTDMSLSQTYSGASISVSRPLSVLVFIVGVLLIPAAIADPGITSLLPVVLVVPYLLIRYRDPLSSTLPFGGYLKT